MSSHQGENATLRSIMQQSQATLLRRYPLGETSWIVVWCTAEHGLVRTAARGARLPKSALAGKLDLFFEAEIAWINARRSDLHALREVLLLSPRMGLRQSYARTVAAAYFAALLEQVVETETPIPEFHDLLVRALDWLSDHEPVPAAIKRYEDRIAELLGIGVAGVASAGALLDTFHKLPPQRQILFEHIFRS